VVGAAILAGGLSDDALLAKAGTRERALIPLHGRPMLEYVIEALQGCSTIDEAVIACPADFEVAKRDWNGVPHVAVDGPDPIDSIVAGAKALESVEKVLLCASDLPLLTPEAIDEFVTEGLEADADCCYPIVEERLIEAEFPGCPRTYVTFRDGRFTSGNIALVARSFVIDQRDKIHQAFGLRKSPLKMASLLGPMMVLGLALGTSSIDGLRQRAAKALGSSVALIKCRHPEIAFDVDKPSDLELAEQVLAQRLGGPAPQ
jgi:molybdopterin-guanine dinucleotide biosynthesis protein A